MASVNGLSCVLTRRANLIAERARLVRAMEKNAEALRETERVYISVRHAQEN